MAAGHVLIIEDDSRIAELYASKLRRGGYEVDVARDGVSGFDLAGSLLPDAIILDIHLPRLSGLAALAVLRREEATSSIPVIVLSNDDTPAVMEEAGRLGVSAYLIKSMVLPQDVAETLSDLWHGSAEMAGSLRSAAGRPPHEKAPGAADHSAPVLVVDEHAATRQMVQTALELDGYQVLGAGGVEASMAPEQRQASGRLGPEPAGSSGHPVSADDRLATVIRANQEGLVDELTSNLSGLDDPGLRRTYPSDAALRLFIEAFVEALRRSFTAAGGKPFVNEDGVGLGRRYAAEAGLSEAVATHWRVRKT